MGALCCSGDKVGDNSPTQKGSSASRSKSMGYTHYDHQVLSSESSYLNYFSKGSVTSLPTGVCGLVNLGNTCFINSALQCMASVPTLTNYFLSGSYKSELNRKTKLGGMLSTLFASLLQQRWRDGMHVARPVELVNHIWRYSHFSPRSQNDSQEFLAYFLDQLHEDLNRAEGKKGEVLGVGGGGVQDEALAALAWQAHLRRNSSIIVDSFHGLLKSSLTCLRCHHTSITFEPFLFLSVPIPSGRYSSLKDCLVEFTKEEKLGGSERWTCPKCSVPMEALKKLDIWKVPPILIIHLKRFYCQHESMGKLNKAITYPLTSLNMEEFVTRPGRLPPYHLIAKINHMGSITSGHYTANALLGTAWMEYDDERCGVVEPGTLQTPNTYVLLYAASKDVGEFRCGELSASICSSTTVAE